MNSRAFRDAIETSALKRAANTRIVHLGGTPTAADNWMFDFRALILQPDWLSTYAELFWERFASALPFQIGGMETAAIPLVSAIVMKGKVRGTPVSGFYIRKSRDKDGLMKQIEGTLSSYPVILVDDLMNSGASLLKQVVILETNGQKVSDVFTVLRFRETAAYDALTRRGIRLHSLFTLADFKLELPKQTQSPQELFETVWKFSGGEVFFEHVIQRSAPVIDDMRVYFGTDNGTFFAVDQATGALVWQFEVGKHPEGKGVFSSPALYDGVVYFGAYDGNVYALDAETGNEKWRNGYADWIGSSPALAPRERLLYIGCEFGLFRKRGGIAAIDMKSGTTRWTDRTPQLTHGSPLHIPEEHMVVIGSNDGALYAYDAARGTRKWWMQTGGDIKTRPAYDAKRQQVLVPSMDGRLYALSAKDGALRWAFLTHGGIYSNPLVVDDRVLVASLDKSLYAVDLESGKEEREFATGGRIFASPRIADNALWIGSNDGRLYELDPETLKMRGSHQFAERIVNAIAYNPATKRFFVPTVANELHALKRVSLTLQ